jgi:hypothetical protein
MGKEEKKGESAFLAGLLACLLASLQSLALAAWNI